MGAAGARQTDGNQTYEQHNLTFGINILNNLVTRTQTYSRQAIQAIGSNFFTENQNYQLVQTIKMVFVF